MARIAFALASRCRLSTDAVMVKDPQTQKADFRRAMKLRLPSVGSVRMDALVTSLLARWERSGAAAIALYAAMPHELNLHDVDRELRQRDARRIYPQIVAGNLQFVDVRNTSPPDWPRDRLGIPTPPHSHVVGVDDALILVPGLAFDPQGRRLGRGKGYYDRLLSLVKHDHVVGVCFDEQLVEHVPCEPHDVMVPWLATPTRGVFAATSRP